MTGAPAPVSLREALGLCLLAGRSRLVATLLLAAASAALPLLGLYAMQWLIDAVADGLRGVARPAAAFEAVLVATGLAAAVALLGNLLRSALAIAAETHGRQLTDASTQRLQEHTAGLDLAEFDRAAFHDQSQHAGLAASQRPARLAQDLAGFASALVSLLLMSAVLAVVQPWLPLAVAAAAVPVAYARRRHARLRFAWQMEHTQQQRDVGYLGAVLGGRATAKDLRALQAEAWFGARLRALRGTLRQSLRRLAVVRARDELLVQTLASGAMFAAYAWLGNLALQGGLTLGALVLHAQAVQRVQNGVRDLLAAGAAIGENRLFLRPLLDLLALQPRLGAMEPTASAPAAAPALGAVDLHFTYPDSPAAALRGVTFTIAPGEHVALAGPNGSGKSTLVKLLTRLYDPTTGMLTVDGGDLRRVPLVAWRGAVAVLFQDANSFELTIAENLRLALPAAVPDAELWRVLDIVGLGARVKALPRQLCTPLSRRVAGGVEWSGGELRRLLLARTLVRPAQVLVLDEPYAQLDGAGAARLAAELRARRGRQTIVVVDHRPAAVQAADRVLLLAEGQLVAAGAWSELREREPRWRILFPDA